MHALPYADPYDWPAMRDFLAARAIPGVEAVAAGLYRRTIAVDGAHGTIAVGPERDGSALRVTIHFPLASALPSIIERIGRIFDLAADPVAIDTHLAQDPWLAPLVSARPGMRVPGAWDGFEVAVRAVLGQQITVGGATKLAGKLVAAFGAPIAAKLADAPALTHVFPTAQRLAAIPADVLSQTLGMPRARGAALIAIANAAVADPRLFDSGGMLDDGLARLRRLPGIGEWTAQYIAMRALRAPDAFMASDIGLLRAMAHPETGVRPKPAELLARAERWRPWRAYAVMHLWMSARQIGA